MFQLTLLLSAICVFAANAQNPHFVIFDGPGATQTYASAINSLGEVTGFYADDAGGHGYVRLPNGTIDTFDAPGSPDIFPDSINSTGFVAGNYGEVPQFGFIRDSSGNFTTFSVPGSFPSSSGNPIVINNKGVVAGPYFDGTTMHGFVRAPGGSVITVDAPSSTYTYVTGINARGALTGIYNDIVATSHGFVRQSNGQWISFDVPGNNFGFFPPVLSINSSGEVVGSYFQGMTHGFLWQPGGSMAILDVPGASATVPSGINSSRTVAGSYQDSSFHYHGFARTFNGVFHTFSAPNAVDTFVVGINDTGVMAGYYLDSNGVSHGFVLQ